MIIIIVTEKNIKKVSSTNKNISNILGSVEENKNKYILTCIAHTVTMQLTCCLDKYAMQALI